jgi:hypothetical protein
VLILSVAASVYIPDNSLIRYSGAGATGRCTYELGARGGSHRAEGAGSPLSLEASSPRFCFSMSSSILINCSSSLYSTDLLRKKLQVSSTGKHTSLLDHPTLTDIL